MNTNDAIQTVRPTHLTAENQKILDIINDWRDRVWIDPEKLAGLLRPCRVRVLLVTDGILDFSGAGFGLRTFVETLLTMPGSQVRFRITLAHMEARAGDAMMDGDARIQGRVPEFKFDNAAHFKPADFDEVWMFGIATSYARDRNAQGNPVSSAKYPANRLGDAELAALATFMDGGGGLFATGDHGSLGQCLGGSVPRAQAMRLWQDDASGTVSMGGPNRNDTNRPGDPGSQFNDQSDDIPQEIQPELFHSRSGFWRLSYPHPLLCGPRGVIKVMPDHPHEGECLAPANPDPALFPGANAAGPRPIVISKSSVLPGTVSGTKDPTALQQPFGGICAYDGHAAARGRVVTDATWHHFVNINLVGDAGATPPKTLGFLASPAGQAHLEDVKTYYRNIAVWIARPENITCMNRRWIWWLLRNERVMEATLTTVDVRLKDLSPRLIWEVGKHARDVLGKFAGQCQSRRLALDLLVVYTKLDLKDLLDPWRQLLEPKPPEPPIPWIELDPVLDLALGGAVIALREAMPEPSEQAPKDDAIDKAIATGVQRAAKLAGQSFLKASEALQPTMTALGK